MYAAVNSDCVGCGSCEAICPQVFRINSYDIAEALINPVPKEAEKSCQEAANICPVAAITID